MASSGRAGRRVLVVEDDEGVREAVREILATEGCIVATCNNGIEALQYLRDNIRPDLIVLDLMMPLMNGWEFRVRQKADPAIASIPVLATSADTTEKAAAIDADAYLKKPYAYSEFINTINRMILDVERRQLNAQLARSERLAALGTLAGGVAHELNNPLAFVTANLDFVLEELQRLSLPEAGRDSAAAGGAPSQAESLAELIDPLKEARVGAERMRQIILGLNTFTPVDDERRSLLDLRQVLETAISLAQNQIRYRAALVREFSDVPPVEANDARLGQVFLNLLVNAAQALPEGSPERNEIRVLTGTDAAGNAIVEVRDTGSGIAAEHLGRLFEPFFTTKPIGTATGLGLFICHNIVTALGGQIVVESELGRGSVFRVVLPGAQRPAAVRPEATASRSEGRRHILVVDDEPMVAAAVKRMLRADHDVTTRYSAREALDLVVKEGSRFHLILCDLMMPDMTGMELHAELCAQVPEQASRMVFLTGGAFTATARTFLDRVPNPCLEKPFDVHYLRLLVHRLSA